jgi:hypothetical protein
MDGGKTMADQVPLSRAAADAADAELEAVLAALNPDLVQIGTANTVTLLIAKTKRLADALEQSEAEKAAEHRLRVQSEDIMGAAVAREARLVTLLAEWCEYTGLREAIRTSDDPTEYQGGRDLLARTDAALASDAGKPFLDRVRRLEEALEWAIRFRCPRTSIRFFEETLRGVLDGKLRLDPNVSMPRDGAAALEEPEGA